MQRQELVKEVLYRSIHRGCKETDHLVGGFAKACVDDLSDDDLVVFKDLVTEDDMLIYDWILGKIKVAQKYQKLIEKMREFHSLA